MVATLSRSGSGGYAVADRRSYDAWGSVRSQQSGGDPKLRYCASLGHRQDDESGLVYMRARYYEPASGRFLSEDPGRSGRNWFSYCDNNPVNASDRSGNTTEWSPAWYAVGYGFEIVAWTLLSASNYAAGKDTVALVTASMGAAGMAVFAFSMSLCSPGTDWRAGAAAGFMALGLAGSGPWVEGMISSAVAGAKVGSTSLASQAVMWTFMYSLEVMGALVATDMDG